MCAKYSDFLCIWLRKYDFLTGKVRYWSDPDPKLFIPDPDPDPAKSSGSGSRSGSTTLIFIPKNKFFLFTGTDRLWRRNS